MTDNYVTIYRQEAVYHVVGHFNGETYHVRSRNENRAVEYARQWLYDFNNKRLH